MPPAPTTSTRESATAPATNAWHTHLCKGKETCGTRHVRAARCRAAPPEPASAPVSFRFEVLDHSASAPVKCASRGVAIPSRNYGGKT
jgi:hypothetical protein